MGVIFIEKFSFNLLSDCKVCISMHKTNLGQAFNRLCGRNETHIANNTGHMIKVTITSKVSTIVEETVEVNTKDGIKYKRVLDLSTIESWMDIPHGKTQKFDRQGHPGDYLTIAKLYDYGYVIIIRNYTMGVNFSYIVERDGTLSKQKYGSSDLFQKE